MHGGVRGAAKVDRVLAVLEKVTLEASWALPPIILHGSPSGIERGQRAYTPSQFEPIVARRGEQSTNSKAIILKVDLPARGPGHRRDSPFDLICLSSFP